MAELKISREMLEQMRALTLMDNDFMNIALEGNIPCVEEMLRIILKKDDLKILTAQTQRIFQGFSRSIYLDVFAEDSAGTRYNIEIQNSDEGADYRRARFYSAMIDAHSLKAGQKFNELPECYVIFITRNDILGYGKLIYTVHRYIELNMNENMGENFTRFNDGSHIVYINCAAKDNGTQLWKLIHDIQCAEPDKMFLPKLSARVKFLKEQEEGIKNMSSYFDNLIEKAVKKGVKKAVDKAVKKEVKKESENIALKLIKLGEITFEKIAECTGLTLAQVKQLADSSL